MSSEFDILSAVNNKICLAILFLLTLKINYVKIKKDFINSKKVNIYGCKKYN